MSARAWRARKPGPNHLTGKQRRWVASMRHYKPRYVLGLNDCPNDEHRLNTCHCCVGSGVVEDFDGDVPCARCHGRGHLHEPADIRRMT